LPKAKEVVANPSKMLQLITVVRTVMGKNGLRKIKSKLQLFASYVSDVVRGRYKEHDALSLVLIVATLLYVVTPLDFIPDFIPTGWIDDIAIVTWAVKKLSHELERYAMSKSAENKSEIE
jgi:uncharacterized membrane protein YkvA (DUF1232 family)